MGRKKLKDTEPKIRVIRGVKNVDSVKDVDWEKYKITASMTFKMPWLKLKRKLIVWFNYTPDDDDFIDIAVSEMEKIFNVGVRHPFSCNYQDIDREYVSAKGVKIN